MCGRTALALEPEDIRYQLGGVPWYDENIYRPSYNVAPSHFQPVVLHRNAAQDIEKDYKKVCKGKAKQYVDEKGEAFDVEMKTSSIEENQEGLDSMKEISKFLKIKSMRWGLIPSWTASGGNKSGLNPINIRDDSLTINNKAMFKNLKARNRCLVVAQGFYEWKREGKGKTASKTPYFSHLASKKTSEIMLIGALYDQVKIKDELVFSYAVITTSATQEFSSVHDRMPLIFDPIEDQEEILDWLSPATPFNDTIKEIIHPLESELNTYQVSSLVNGTKNNDSSFIVPLSEEDKTQAPDSPVTLESFFKKESKNQLVNPSTKRKKTNQEDDLICLSSDTETKKEPKQEKLNHNVVSLLESD